MAATAASATEIVFALLQRRDYESALAEAQSLPTSHPDRDALERVSYARMGRFSEAVVAGRRHLAKPSATPEDYFRQAQILLRCHCIEEAFDMGMIAVSAQPEDWRLLCPVFEAVLAEPRLEARFRARAAPIVLRRPRVPPPVWAAGGGVLLPHRLPHFAPLGGEHPNYYQFCELLDPIPRYRPETYGSGLLAKAVDALPSAIAAVDRLISAGIGVGRRAAARYVGSRMPSLLIDDGGCGVEIVVQTNMTLGQRPYFVHFDFMPMLFYPFSPAEHMTFPEDDEEIFRIIGHELDGPSCLGFLNHCQEQAHFLAAAFDNPRLAKKSHYINVPSNIGDRTSSQSRRRRGQSPTVSLLFTTSFKRSDENFLARGGIDVLHAFLDLYEEFDHLRLNLCGQVPLGLDPVLVDRIKCHPAINWRRDFIPQGEYEEIFSSSDIYVSPSVATYRNGLVQAMLHGLVPVVSDCHYAAEVVTHNVSGLVVEGRRRMADIRVGVVGFRCDWREIYGALDKPSDQFFFSNYKRALRNLIIDRASLQRMSEYNLTKSTSHELSSMDVEKFRKIIGDGLDSNGG